MANDVFMEPVTGVDKINKQRWKLVSKRLLRIVASLINLRNVLFVVYEKVPAFNA